MKVGRDALDRKLPFENSPVLNPAGTGDVADSPGPVRKPFVEWRKSTAGDLKFDWNICVP